MNDQDMFDEINCGKEIKEILKKYNCKIELELCEYSYSDSFDFRLEFKKIKT